MEIDFFSVNELITEQDVEGFIADGAPADEYESEVELALHGLQALPKAEATKDRIVELLEGIWRKNFSLSDADLQSRQPAFEAIADRILHFFG